MYLHTFDRIARTPLDARSGGGSYLSYDDYHDLACKPMHHARAPVSAQKKKAGTARGEAELGNTAKSVGRPPEKPWQQGRMDRFRHQRHAAKLLGYEERVGLCKHAVSSVADGVNVILSTYGEGKTRTERASFEGLQTCGSVWHCPVCAARISEERRGEMNALLAWAREQGHAPFMITLTSRHGVEDELPDLLDGNKRAKQKLHQHRAWKRLAPWIVGHVTATEVTGGGPNGWHVHYHVLLIVQDAKDTEMNFEIVRLLEGLGDPWRASLRGVGLDGGGAAFDLQDATAAGAYVAKWGAAEELTMAGSKRAYKGGNRTPAQLLAASCDDDDTRAGVLWSTYARTFKGRRQLTWSRGLKAAAGIGEVSDADAAVDDIEDDQERRESGQIKHSEWAGQNGACRRRGLILNAAEDDGEDGVRAVIEAGGEDPKPEPFILFDEPDPDPEPDPEPVALADAEPDPVPQSERDDFEAFLREAIREDEAEAQRGFERGG